MGCDSLRHQGHVPASSNPGSRIISSRNLKAKSAFPSRCIPTIRPVGRGQLSAAIDAGVDCVEVSIVPFCQWHFATGHPEDARPAGGHPRCPNLTRPGWRAAQIIFEGVYKELAKFTSPANERVDSDILIYAACPAACFQFPHAIEEQGMSERFRRSGARNPRGARGAGLDSLVTPTSQIVGTQAMMNVKVWPLE